MPPRVCAAVPYAPFGGLIASILIYTIRRDDPIARENQRNALDFEITLVLLWLFGTVLCIVGFKGITIVLGSIFVFYLIAITGAIMSGFGARAAFFGRVFTYPITFDLVR